MEQVSTIDTAASATAENRPILVAEDLTMSTGLDSAAALLFSLQAGRVMARS